MMNSPVLFGHLIKSDIKKNDHMSICVDKFPEVMITQWQLPPLPFLFKLLSVVSLNVTADVLVRWINSS